MPNSQSDRNLLFGILALQMDFISREALVQAMNAWVLTKTKPLGQILLDLKAFTADTHALLEALVQKHVALHGNDAEKSLASVTPVGSIKRDLERIADAGIQASLAQWGDTPGRDNDPLATITQAVGLPTGAGSRFRILRPHAQGGLGRVYVAHDDELHREVALKEIQSEHADNQTSRARFLLEAEITGGLEHPGIVPVYGLGQYADGRPFYAMRFIRGDSLKDAIHRFHQAERTERASGERTLELRQLLGRFIDVCQAIQYAHDRGILHRDLKPGNIMLGKYGETLVVDWGLAKSGGRGQEAGVGKGEPGALATGVLNEPLLRPSSGSSAETVTGSALGTPAYMSPEQAAGRLDQLGPASDVYSLGATLYSLLTGQPPVPDKDVAEVLKKVQSGDIARPRQVKPGIDPALEAICLKAMAVKPEGRYLSPRALADDLEHWLADEPVGAYAEPWLVRTGRWARKHKPLVSGVAAALLVGLSALFWQQSRLARQQTLAEERIRQSLDQVAHARAELHKALKKDGGVQELLTQPARWQALVNAARADWQRAKDVLAQAEDNLAPHWVSLLKTREEELARDQADYDLAQRLEKIRLDTVNAVDRKFDHARAAREYPAEFKTGGITIEPGRQKEAAALIQQAPIKDQLLGALDHWAWIAYMNDDENLCTLLLDIGRLADPDPWHDKVRDLQAWKNAQAVASLAEQIQADPKVFRRLTPQMLVLVADLFPANKSENAWLRQAQAEHPTDFWVNFKLASSLYMRNEAAEAAGFFRVSLAIRPESAVAYCNLGAALFRQKELNAAVTAFDKALKLEPRYATALNNLGMALAAQNKLPDALDAFHRALAIDPKYARAWNNLGFTLAKRKDLSAAIDAYHKAIAIDPQFDFAWYNLGHALAQQKNQAAAIDAYRNVVAIDPRQAMAWNNLGFALLETKDLSGAIQAFNKALEVEPGFDLASNNLDNAHRLVALEKKLPGVLKGETAKPIDLLALASHCQFYKKHYLSAAELYGKAFELEPKAAEDLKSAYRYNAACAAALAAARQGLDARNLDGKERALLRGLALDWLQDDLIARAGIWLSGKDPAQALQFRDLMRHWQRDADLAGVRDDKERGELPEDERAALAKFWKEVERLTNLAQRDYHVTEHKGRLTDKQREQTHTLQVSQGKTYVIDMESAEADSYLRLHDAQDKIVAENDDFRPTSRHARIVFTPLQSATYRVVATSFERLGQGDYTVTISEFAPKKK